MMFKSTLIAAAIFAMCLLVLPASAISQEVESVRHASPALIELAADFREFRSPLFRSRTWRPTHRVEGVPDYAEVKKEQIEGLARFREKLNAMNPRDWPVHDQVDYLLLRSEMDDVYFEQHILREVETNPGYYIEQAINGVAREIPDVVPYSTETAAAIIAAFERTGPIVEQGPANIIIADASPELAAMGIRHVEDIREQYAAGVNYSSPNSRHHTVVNCGARRPRRPASWRITANGSSAISSGCRVTQISVRRTCFGSSTASTSFPGVVRNC